MPKLLSTADMIRALFDRIESDALSPNDKAFVRNIAQRAEAGEVTKLSGPQLDYLAGLHERVFE